MKKLGFYAVIVTALVFALWFCTKDGMKPDEAAAPPVDSVGAVLLESRSMGRRVRVEDPEDIGRLSETLSTLSEENGVMVDLNEDFPEHMRDWTLEWLSRAPFLSSFPSVLLLPSAVLRQPQQKPPEVVHIKDLPAQ